MLNAKPTYADLNAHFTIRKPPRHMPLEPERIPEPFRGLLANTEHMTVTLEKFHGEPVSVKALEVVNDENGYGRRIVLSTSRGVVLYGIVKIDLEALPKKAAEAILAAEEPLGRILLNHKIETRVEPSGYFMLAATAEMAGLFKCADGTTVYGRLGTIYSKDVPIVELLEIPSPVAVPPESDPQRVKPAKKVREMIFGNH